MVNAKEGQIGSVCKSLYEILLEWIKEDNEKVCNNVCVWFYLYDAQKEAKLYWIYR